MPLLGLGTSHQGGSSQEAIEFAVKECGYRLLDTAMRYGTEHLVGNAVKEAGVQREEQQQQTGEREVAEGARHQLVE